MNAMDLMMLEDELASSDKTTPNDTKPVKGEDCEGKCIEYERKLREDRHKHDLEMT